METVGQAQDRRRPKPGRIGDRESRQEAYSDNHILVLNLNRETEPPGQQ